MIDVRAWAEYVVEWAAKDPYGFLTTVILALTPLFIASALLSWKLAKMIEARDREQKKKQKRQENIAKAKRTKKDWACECRMRALKRGATITPTALLIQSNDTVPFLVPALLSAQGHDESCLGWKEGHWTTGHTVLRRTVLPEDVGSCRILVSKSLVLVSMFLKCRDTQITLCSCQNTFAFRC